MRQGFLLDRRRCSVRGGMTERLRARHCRGKFKMLRGVATDVIPRCLRSNEDVHLDLNARIAVNCTESDSMYVSLVHPAERGAAGLAEAQTPSRSGLILSQIVFPAGPREGTGCDLRVCGTRAAERLSTPRAVAASTATKWRSDLVTDTTAKTSTGQGHHFSLYRSADDERGASSTPDGETGKAATIAKCPSTSLRASGKRMYGGENTIQAPAAIQTAPA